ncbi:Thiamine pyrophosphokinase [Ignavibacterium album JCM 16511]|uniref:Thiamine diphosphokinase n=1 Tax=Ignavibacterium album (strain DSM 19864 / JCM 16511 / NBRC 101810 / Mat9-16) TaxID=945713 RepID=I0AKE9_IGNAJ|nr:thiamine diphosphokinase [Ignavibacterium album]AFH49456.1 Thiamine pyrophosphokinase [Ignavibacterium album JCM 16511]
MKKCIIIANGRTPSKKVISFFEKKGYTTLICADGGANSAAKLGLVPDFIIGDLDSVNAETIKFFSGKSTIIKIKRQNDTDVEKCLKFAIKKGFSEALLLGVTGDRLDHTICNLGIVLKFFDKIKCSIVAENSFLTPINQTETLKSRPGETISLYAFNSKTKITSIGLKYKLKNSTLPFGKRESTSNVSTQSEVKLNIRGGIVFIIRDFNFIAKNDLI